MTAAYTDQTDHNDLSPSASLLWWERQPMRTNRSRIQSEQRSWWRSFIVICLVRVSSSHSQVTPIVAYLWMTALGIHGSIGLYTMKQKSEFFDILKKFYADTAIIRNQHCFCCLRRDNAEENMSSAAKNWLVEQGIKSENSTAHEPW